MSLKPEPVCPVPPQTRRIAKVAFPKGNTVMAMRDELGVLCEDEKFINLFSREGRSAIAPWRLTLVTLMQFTEGLTDRQAAEAVRSRIDWKYALSLELEDDGFDFSVLSEFRTRLLKGQGEYLIFDTILELV
jgi:transposase